MPNRYRGREDEEDQPKKAEERDEGSEVEEQGVKVRFREDEKPEEDEKGDDGEDTEVEEHGKFR